MKTIRCDVLKRMAVAGNLLYVGGYSFDDLMGEDRPDHDKNPLPVKYLAKDEPRGPDGTVYLRDSAFERGKTGREEVMANGLRKITLRHHSNHYQEFVRKDEYEAMVAARAAVA